MTSATLLTSSLATVQSPSVGNAVHELAVAAHRLILVLWATTVQRFVTAPRALTRAEEANQVRDMANELMRTDPRFAQDLYAAADRHELSTHV